MIEIGNKLAYKSKTQIISVKFFFRRNQNVKKSNQKIQTAKLVYFFFEIII